MFLVNLEFKTDSRVREFSRSKEENGGLSDTFDKPDFQEKNNECEHHQCSVEVQTQNLAFEFCKEYKKHEENYVEARKAYCKDKTTKSDANPNIYAADM